MDGDNQVKEIERKRFLKEAFSRNLGIISEDEQSRIFDSKVAIAGLGGVGGAYCTGLARTGFGKFSIADFDKFEDVNINRQTGATISTIGEKKLDVMERMIKDVNPYVEINSFSEGINIDNIDSFLENVDIAIDGLDFFAIEERILFFKKAREKKIVAITAAPIGYGASILVFNPKGMSFEKYFDIKDTDSYDEKLIKFGIGLCPKLVQNSYVKTDKFDLQDKKTPSLYGGIMSCNSAVIAKAVKVILRKNIKCAPYSYQYDPFAGKMKHSRTIFGNKGIIQKIKISYIKNKTLNK